MHYPRVEQRHAKKTMKKKESASSRSISCSPRVYVCVHGYNTRWRDVCRAHICAGKERANMYIVQQRKEDKDERRERGECCASWLVCGSRVTEMFVFSRIVEFLFFEIRRGVCHKVLMILFAVMDLFSQMHTHRQIKKWYNALCSKLAVKCTFSTLTEFQIIPKFKKKTNTPGKYL